MIHTKLIILLLVIPLGLFAQKSKTWNKAYYDAEPYHFGFSFSAGVLDFDVTHATDFGSSYDSVYSVEAISKPVFGAYIVGVYKINDFLDLRFSPGMSFGQRNISYLLQETEGNFKTEELKLESTNIQFPMLVKYRATRQGNYRPYFVGGLNYTIDLAARKGVEYGNDRKDKWLKSHDVLAEVGFGVDYYLSFFKFSTELKFSYGLMDISYDNGMQYTTVFDRLGTKMFTFNIFFE